MKVIDFARSFLTFRIDTQKKPPETVTHKLPTSLNSARILINCRLEITEKDSGHSQEFVLGANCKTERVGVERDIWTEPNADFVPVFSSRQFLFIKTYDRVGQSVPLYSSSGGNSSDRQTGLVEDAFDELRIDIVYCQAEPIQKAKQTVAATLENHRLIARTEIETDRYRVVLDYPINTMNANGRDNIFQTDTGPVLLPDLELDLVKMIERIELAFCAFNCPDWIEFIVRQPTSIGNGKSVWHYSQTRRYEAKNKIFRILDSVTPQSVATKKAQPHFLKSEQRDVTSAGATSDLLISRKII